MNPEDAVSQEATVLLGDLRAMLDRRRAGQRLKVAADLCLIRRELQEA